MSTARKSVAAAKTPAPPAPRSPAAKKLGPVKTAPVPTPPATPKAATKVAAKRAVAPVAPLAAKPPKQKLVRDSFTIPRAEYAVLDALKQRLIQLARPAKKSEVLRAGIKLLATLPDAALLDALAAVPEIKTGRPKKAR